MTERRFNEIEVAAIFERATEAREHRQRELPSPWGARGLIIGGLGIFGAATTTLIAALLRSPVGDVGMLSALGFFAASGLGMLGIGALRLPSWARLRRQQMEQLAERLALVANSSTNA